MYIVLVCGGLCRMSICSAKAQIIDDLSRRFLVVLFNQKDY